jgi:hypothetical protein
VNARDHQPPEHAARSALTYAERVAKVVNLNKFRKQKERAEAKKRAETNVRLGLARGGRTKAERELESKQRALLEKKVDGARLSNEPESDEDA